jgi:hypothetical protein
VGQEIKTWFSIVLTVLVLWAPSEVIAQTVVFSPASADGAKARHTRKVANALGDAKFAGARMVERIISADCAASASCLAKEGATEGARRAVGLVLRRPGGKFHLDMLLVDTKTGREIRRSKTSTLRRKDLSGNSWTYVVDFVTGGDGAGNAPDSGSSKPPPPTEPEGEADSLIVSVPRSVPGDGRTPAAISVTGGPEPRTGERKDLPEPPSISCEGLPSLAEHPDQLPAVLPPVVAHPTSIACVAQHRGAKKAFDLSFVPPAKGLHAGVKPRQMRAGDSGAQVVATLNGQGKGAVASVRASVSHGSLERTKHGRWTLDVPSDTTPRMIAIALTDGTHHAATFFPVIGTAVLPVEVARRSSVEVRIGGWFSESVKVQRKTANVPIEVRPGNHRAVVRATRRGLVRESVIDLKVPDYVRLAAVGQGRVAAGGDVEIAVAVVGADGHPASAVQLVTKADRGRTVSTKALGGGLFAIAYRAPAELGPDQLTISIADDPGAGEAAVALEVVAGSGADIQVIVDERKYGPGEELLARLRIVDGGGNPAARGDVRATLAGQQLEVYDGPDGIHIKGHIPKRLPENGKLELVVTAGSRTAQTVIEARALKPVSAAIELVPRGRRAIVLLDVRDQYGNLVALDGFEVRGVGAEVQDLRAVDGRYSGVAIAAASGSSATIEVVGGGESLARENVRFGVDDKALLLGAFGRAGWVDSGGDISTVRFGGGVGVRRGLFGLEFSLLVGAEGLVFDDSTMAALGGSLRQVDRSVTMLSFPIGLRARLGLSHWLGVSVGGGIVPTRAKVDLSTDFQAPDRYTEFVLGLRGELALDARVGPGRLFVGGSYGYAKLSEGPLGGSLEGLSITAGYEWWFVELGR